MQYFILCTCVLILTFQSAYAEKPIQYVDRQEFEKAIIQINNLTKQVNTIQKYSTDVIKSKDDIQKIVGVNAKQNSTLENLEKCNSCNVQAGNIITDAGRASLSLLGTALGFAGGLGSVAAGIGAGVGAGVLAAKHFSKKYRGVPQY